ncbi:hypothetical protein F5Y16DRAFT_34931 [Xylariaceae sp. FL0255]|nr:hypothetical protein F5Y16DRAFT_34931 [Xylariaceae sp. FL0255]
MTDGWVYLTKLPFALLVIPGTDTKHLSFLLSGQVSLGTTVHLARHKMTGYFLSPYAYFLLVISLHHYSDLHTMFFVSLRL